MIGHAIIRVEETASTNDLAREFAGRVDADGIVVLAGRQTNGKGRLGRSWFSPPDTGIYMSVIIKRRLNYPYPFLICPAVSLAVAETIEYFSDLEPRIKWPNDIVVNSKKIGGILVERNNDVLIAGIGINLNVDPCVFPDEIKDKATSLMAESGRNWDKEEFLKKLSLALEDVLSTEEEEILDRLIARSFTLGKIVKVSDGKNVFQGKAEGFESDGSLLLRTADGKMINIKSGEIG